MLDSKTEDQIRAELDRAVNESSNDRRLSEYGQLRLVAAAREAALLAGVGRALAKIEKKLTPSQYKVVRAILNEEISNG